MESRQWHLKVVKRGLISIILANGRKSSVLTSGVPSRLGADTDSSSVAVMLKTHITIIVDILL